MKTKEKCGATYINGEVCVRPKNHWGKHEAGDQHGWLMWTDGGLQRELQERAAKAQGANLSAEPKQN